MNFYNKQIKPKLFFIPYFIVRVALFIPFIFKGLSFKPYKRSKSNILLSAGKIGWKSIEYKEILQSAIEFIGDEKRVVQHILENNNNYIEELRIIFQTKSVTHFFYDPRTGHQTLIKGFIDSIRILGLLIRYNVIPIVYLTDISDRKWRMKGAVVSCFNGIALSFLAPKLIGAIFPHNRLIGPSIMPFSKKTFLEIQKNVSYASKHVNETKAYFIGSLYEPRITELNHVKDSLKKDNKDLILLGRLPGNVRRTDEEYWNTIINAPIVITTTNQILEDYLDWNWVPSLVYRYLEALICETLLVAPEVPSVKRYFEPNQDFISFNSLEEASKKIKFYLDNKDERELIAKSGNQKAKSLILSKTFWTTIDTSLKKNCIISN
jgi:hypothetical protein